MGSSARPHAVASKHRAITPHDRRQQVAAVCYRASSQGIEFLLVRTSGRRWTFPKGGLEPGMTPAQSAALEAFEEAGVHGRIEQLAFASYRRASADSKDPLPTLAFLCEVRRLSPPQERGRDRTWFSVEKAKRRLQDGRSSACSAEFLAVLDRAVTRIRRLRTNSDHRQVSRSRTNEGLQRMYFEASETLLAQKVAASFLRMQRRSSSAIESRNFPPRKLLTSGSQTTDRPRLVLVEGKSAIKPHSRRTR